ncbi:MAG: PilW family protein [Gammaproteobacteria bacterium]
MRSLGTTSQRGFSLVELMVALLIGVILTSGVISVYITSKASYSMNTGLGQVQEAGRYALGIMQPILVVAGNTGCRHPLSNTVSLPTMINSTDPVYNLRHAVYGFEYTGTGIGNSGSDTSSPTLDNSAGDWGPALSVSPVTQNALHNRAAKGSDVLMVHELIADPTPAVISGDDDSPSGTLTYATTNAPAMSAGELMIASNCGGESMVFQATDVTSTTVSHAYSGTPGNTVPPGGVWPHFDLSGGGVGPAQTYVFFVGSGVGGESSLFEASLDATTGVLGTPKEMVPGVESMQVLYGVDTGNSDGTSVDMDFIPNYYGTAQEVETAGAWDRVVSVRVALLVHSDLNTTDKAPSSATKFHMLGTVAADSFTYTPNADRRLRRYFVQTFSLRNMLP